MANPSEGSPSSWLPRGQEGHGCPGQGPARPRLQGCAKSFVRGPHLQMSPEANIALLLQRKAFLVCSETFKKGKYISDF